MVRVIEGTFGGCATGFASRRRAAGLRAHRRLAHVRPGLVEFYYINRMLNVGGVVAFDVPRPGINRVIRCALNHDAYSVYGGQAFAPTSRAAVSAPCGENAAPDDLAAFLTGV